MRGENGGRRQRFPTLVEQIGEDPARYLDRDDLYMAKVRIRGIDFLEVVRAWIAVERRLDRGPRPEVIGLLKEREAFLLEHGDRDERIEPRADRDVPPKDVVWTDPEGRRYKRVDGEFGIKKEYLEGEA